MWLLLPVLTPVMVIATALALQRFERIILMPNPVVLPASDPARDQHTPAVRGEPKHGERIENPFPLSSNHEHRSTLVVASASTDATDRALLVAVLGLRPAHRTAFDDHAS